MLPIVTAGQNKVKDKGNEKVGQTLTKDEKLTNAAIGSRKVTD